MTLSHFVIGISVVGIFISTIGVFYYCWSEIKAKQIRSKNGLAPASIEPTNKQESTPETIFHADMKPETLEGLRAFHAQLIDYLTLLQSKLDDIKEELDSGAASNEKLRPFIREVSDDIQTLAHRARSARASQNKKQGEKRVS